MEEEEDRISSLPDCLLTEIMSRIKIQDKTFENWERKMTTKEVITTTVTISKRWQCLWTLLPNLIFIDQYDTTDKLECINPAIGKFSFNNDLTHYFSFIDKTLTQSPPPYVKLNKFKLYISFDSRVNPHFKSQAITWIHHAIIHRNVQKVHFWLCDIVAEPREFIFDDWLFFNNTCFTNMKLRACLLNPPNRVIRWENLEILHLTEVRLDEDMIEIILSGTPCLKGLELDACYGYRRIDITSKSLRMFTFKNYNGFDEYIYDVDNYIDGIEINAPHLSALTIQGGMCLRKLLLLDVSSLTVVELLYHNSFGNDVVVEEEMLKGLIKSLSHLNEITFGDPCLEVISRLELKGFHFFKDTDDSADDTADDSADDTASDSNSSDSDLS